ncbi:MAG: hypothetical protein K6G65_10285 [Lachnospiraceae bacterium]|nr:hypothetical protein [Lachnospiraceae bacterium]
MRKIFTALFVGFLMINFGVYAYNSFHIFGNYDFKGKGYLEKTRYFIAETDRRITDQTPLKDNYVSLNGLFQRCIGKDIIEDTDPTYTIYKLTNGQLSFAYDEMDVSTAIKNTTDFNDFCKENGVDFLFFMEPYKVNKYNNELPSGYADGANKSGDAFLSGLDKSGVNFVDYREIAKENLTLHDERYYKQDSTQYGSLFFNGDHHWKEETAFNAYIYLMDYLKNKDGLELSSDYTDIKNFDTTTYKDSFIGSQYSRINGLYADALDDFTVIKPLKTENTFTHEIYNGKGKLREDKVRTGDFENSVLYSENLKDIKTARRGRDNYYLGHNPALDVITNDSVPDNEILIIEDSFARPISALSSLNFHKVHIMDLRHYQKSVKDYLKENPQIKTVVVCYPPTCFKESTYKKQFDFK